MTLLWTQDGTQLLRDKLFWSLWHLECQSYDWIFEYPTKSIDFFTIKFKFNEHFIQIPIQTRSLTLFRREKNLPEVNNKLLFSHVHRFFLGKAYREMWGMEERVTVWYSILYVSNFGIWFFFSRSTDMRIKWQDRRIQWMFLWFTNREPMLRHQTRLFFCTV